MPKIDRAKLSAKLDTIPEQDREPYLLALKDKGFTWKSGASAPQSDFAAIKATEMAKRADAQKQPPGSVLDVAKGALGVTSDMAFSAPQIAKAGIKAAGSSLGSKDSLPAKAAGAALNFGAEAIPTTPGEAVAQVAGEKALSVAAPYAKPIAKKALGFMAEKFGGLSSETAYLLEKNAPAVMKYARMGYEKASEEASAAGKRFADSISAMMRQASDQYEERAIRAVRGKYGDGFRLNLNNALMDTFGEVRKDYGYGDASPLNFTDEAAQSKFLKVEAAARSLTNATADEVYTFQKRLNKAIDSAKTTDRPLYSALLKVKGATVKYLEGHVPEIQEGNEIYKAGAKLSEELARVENADNPLRIINSALKSRGYVRDAILQLTEKSSEAAAALEDMVSANAGQAVSAWSRHLPNNGLALAPGLVLERGAHAAGASPLAGAAIAAGYTAGTSPRLYGEGFNLISKIPGDAAIKKASPIASNAAIAALRSLRNK